jgi:hypothetical protein
LKASIIAKIPPSYAIFWQYRISEMQLNYRIELDGMLMATLGTDGKEYNRNIWSSLSNGMQVKNERWNTGKKNG